MDAGIYIFSCGLELKISCSARVTLQDIEPGYPAVKALQSRVFVLGSSLNEVEKWRDEVPLYDAGRVKSSLC